MSSDLEEYAIERKPLTREELKAWLDRPAPLREADAAETPPQAADVAPSRANGTETVAAHAETAPDAPVPGGCSLTLLGKGTP